MKYTVRKWMRKRDGDYLIMLFRHPGWFLRLFGVKPDVGSVIGQCTTWNKHPTYHSLSTSMEGMLWRIEKQIKHGDFDDKEIKHDD